MPVVFTIVLLTSLTYLGVISLRVGDPVETLAPGSRENVELSEMNLEDKHDPSAVVKSSEVLDSL
jgi:hypothetical protein